jgi:hypothetical protein
MRFVGFHHLTVRFCYAHRPQIPTLRTAKLRRTGLRIIPLFHWKKKKRNRVPVIFEGLDLAEVRFLLASPWTRTEATFAYLGDRCSSGSKP